MYVVTGITGQVGGAVARRLIEAGGRVRAVVRDAARGAAWRERGCDVAVASMEDGASLAAAFEGAQAVFVLLPPTFDPSPGFTEARRMIESLRSALASANPGRVVALSTIGAQAAQPNLLQQLGLLEQRLGDLPMPLSCLRAGWFMENIAGDIDPARTSGVMRSFLQPLHRAVPMVATADVGRTAADMMMAATPAPRVLELMGEPLSPDDLAAGLARALGREVRAEAVPRGDWQALFTAQGMANPLPRMQMLDGFNEGWIAFEQPEAAIRRGPTRLDQVLRGLLS